jgi:hypothetical protein
LAVEQEAKILNDGDNFMAWKHLRHLIEDGRPLPDWAEKYFLKVVQAMESFDPHEDSPTYLLRAFEVACSPKQPPRKRKSTVSYGHVFWCFSLWMAEGLTVADCIERYVSKFSGADGDEPLDSDTIKSAYYTVRKERIEAANQDRPERTEGEWKQFFSR